MDKLYVILSELQTWMINGLYLFSAFIKELWDSFIGSFFN